MPVFRLATSPIAPVLGQRVPVRGPARLLHRSYARVSHGAGATAGTGTAAPRRERVLTTTTGDRFHVSLDSAQEWHLWAFGSFEPDIAALFGHLIRPGDRCLDVGANIGAHTVRLARLAGPAGEVIAIEPDPELVRRNSRNLELNGLRARLLTAAASDRAGQRVTLYRATDADSNRARASLHHQDYLTGPAVQVETVTVDAAAGDGAARDGAAESGAARDRPVALIKIDVEGHEAAVVAGAAATIARYHPAIVFEYAPELLADPEQCPFEILTATGYQIFRICYPRRRVSGRGTLALVPLPRRPELGGDLLAVTPADAARLSALVRPA
jgi:FkbM family methyltransferase